VKHFAILIAGTLLACSLYATSPNPYPNEINGLKFYEQYLNPLTPHKSDTAQVVQVLGSNQGLELKDWRIRALYSCAEDFLTCSHGPRNDLLDTIEVTPRHRVSLRRFKFPALFSRGSGGVSEINVTCDIYADEFGLEYWIVSQDFPSHRKGDLLMIHYGPRRATDQGQVQR
jgi:hypothetical protein